MTDPDLWILEVKALPSDVPAVNRMRTLLKHALRSLGLKVVVVREPVSGDASVNPGAAVLPSSRKAKVRFRTIDTGTNDRE